MISSSASRLFRVRGRRLALAAALVVVPACHKNSDKPAPAGQSPAPAGTKPTPAGTKGDPVTSGIGITLHATLTLSGTLAGTVSYTQSSNAFQSCADYAAKRDEFDLPHADTMKLPSGETVDLHDSPEHFNGAGTYEAAQLDQSSATLTVNDSDEPYQPGAKGSTRTLTVKPDGSGTYTFSGWLDPGSKSESGSLTWTCSAN